MVFLQRRPKKGWFAVTEVSYVVLSFGHQLIGQEMVPWEEHLIRLKFSHAVKRDSNTALKDALMRISMFCSANKAGVPPPVGASEQSNLSHQVSNICHSHINED